MTSPLMRSLIFKVQNFDLSRQIRSFKTDMKAEIKTLHLKKVKTSLPENYYIFIHTN